MYPVQEETEASPQEKNKKRPGGLGCPPGQIFDGRCVFMTAQQKLGISLGDSVCPKADYDRLHNLLIL